MTYIDLVYLNERHWFCIPTDFEMRGNWNLCKLLILSWLVRRAFGHKDVVLGYPLLRYDMMRRKVQVPCIMLTVQVEMWRWCSQMHGKDTRPCISAKLSKVVNCNSLNTHPLVNIRYQTVDENAGQPASVQCTLNAFMLWGRGQPAQVEVNFKMLCILKLFHVLNIHTYITYIFEKFKKYHYHLRQTILNMR